MRSGVGVIQQPGRWAHGRGHALSWALIFIPYYLDTNPVGVAAAQHTIDEVLAAHLRG